MTSSENQASPQGTLAFEGDYATITFSRLIGHPPEDVWAAITDPEELKGWYMTSAKLTGCREGSIDFVSGPAHFHVTGRVLSWDPPHLFEHEWKVAPRPELPSGEDSIVRWELEAGRPQHAHDVHLPEAHEEHGVGLRAWNARLPRTPGGSTGRQIGA